MLTNEGEKEFIVFCYEKKNYYFSKLSYCPFEVSCETTVQIFSQFGAFLGLQSQKKEFCIVLCMLYTRLGQHPCVAKHKKSGWTKRKVSYIIVDVQFS